MRYKIGIDSGGTHITAQAYTSNKELIAETTAGPGNSFVDVNQTKRNILAALDKLFEELPVNKCELILAGVAGSQSAGNQKELAEYIEKKVQRPTIVLSDAELALLKGLQGSNGLLVIAGTGSIVLGRFNQTPYRAGGWGQLLGDQGSAYDLVRQAFKGMLKEADRGQVGELTALILPIIGVKDIFEAVHLFNRLSRNELAAYGKKFAEHGDQNEAFQAIMKKSGEQLAEQALDILDRAGSLGSQSKIAISGSVLTHNLVVQKSFEQTIKQHYPEVTIIPLTGSNASGVLYYEGVEQS